MFTGITQNSIFSNKSYPHSFERGWGTKTSRGCWTPRLEPSPLGWGAGSLSMENLTIFILLYHGNMIPYHSPLRACLHGGGGPQIVEIGAASHPTYHVNVIKLK